MEERRATAECGRLKQKRTEELNAAAEARWFRLRAGIADIATLRIIRKK
jgi:hypothetical protein